MFNGQLLVYQEKMVDLPNNDHHSKKMAIIMHSNNHWSTISMVFYGHVQWQPAKFAINLGKLY